MRFWFCEIHWVLWIVGSVFASLSILSICLVSLPHIASILLLSNQENVLIAYTCLSFSVLSLLLEQASFKALISNVEGNEWSPSLKKQVFVVLVGEGGIFLRSHSTGWGFLVFVFASIGCLYPDFTLWCVGVCGPCHVHLEIEVCSSTVCLIPLTMLRYKCVTSFHCFEGRLYFHILNVSEIVLVLAFGNILVTMAFF